MTWEIGEKYDIGVDMTLFKDLNFTIDYFRENRKNIFLQRQTISVETGITGTAPYGNLGRVKNEGLDMSFNYNHSFNKDFFRRAVHLRLPRMSMWKEMNLLMNTVICHKWDNR